MLSILARFEVGVEVGVEAGVGGRSWGTETCRNGRIVSRSRPQLGIEPDWSGWLACLGSLGFSSG